MLLLDWLEMGRLRRAEAGPNSLLLRKSEERIRFIRNTMIIDGEIDNHPSLGGKRQISAR